MAFPLPAPPTAPPPIGELHRRCGCGARRPVAGQPPHAAPFLRVLARQPRFRPAPHPGLSRSPRSQAYRPLHPRRRKAFRRLVGAVTVMASKKTVTVENLAALGPDRLVGILMALAKDDADIRRRLRLELAGQAGSEDIAAEITKRLTSIRNARSLVDRRKSRDFLKDLDLQRAMIVDRVASSRPDLALDLMWRFMNLADSVFNRVDDSNGTVGDVFRSACNDLGTLASKAKPDPETLAERVFAAITDNGYGIFDNLVEIVFPALGETGVARLESKLDAALADCPNKGAKHDRRANSLRRALMDLASAEGNVDRYIALVPADDRKQPGIAARIGRKLLNAGRAAEALVALENGAPKQRGSYLNDDLYHPGYEPWLEWEDAYLDALDATGQ